MSSFKNLSFITFYCLFLFFINICGAAQKAAPDSSDMKQVPLCKSQSDPKPLSKCVDTNNTVSATNSDQSPGFLVKSTVCLNENSASYMQELLPKNYQTRCQNLYVAFGADNCLVSVGCSCYIKKTDPYDSKTDNFF